MTVYLRWAKVDDHWIGISRGANALFGLTGATIYPVLKTRWGVWLLGQRSIWYQCSMVMVAATTFFWGTQNEINCILIVFVLLSRIGLWAFDLCARQIAQETIPEHLRGAANGFWGSITAFFDMATYLVAIFCPNPQDFIFLTTISCLVVLSAAIIYTISQPQFLDAEYANQNKFILDWPAAFLRRLYVTSGAATGTKFSSVPPDDSAHGSRL